MAAGAEQGPERPGLRNPVDRFTQGLPHSWRVYSHRYGLDGASPYDPVANVTVAAHVVADDGWGPWAGPGC